MYTYKSINKFIMVASHCPARVRRKWVHGFATYQSKLHDFLFKFVKSGARSRPLDGSRRWLPGAERGVSDPVAGPTPLRR